MAELGGAGRELIGVPREADLHVMPGPRPQAGCVAADAAWSHDGESHEVGVNPEQGPRPTSILAAGDKLGLSRSEIYGRGW
jgi:hypothetical protein